MEKKKYGLLFALLLISIVLLNGDIAFAIPPNVELEGNADGIVFIDGDKPFLVKYDMMPGDVIQRKIVLNNKHEDSYKVYLKAKRITPEEKYDLLNKIDLELFYNGEEFYKGPISGEDGLIHDVYLGTINPRESKVLDAKAEFDGKEIGNEYKNKYAEVEWIFTAIKVPDKNRRGRFEEEIVNKEEKDNIVKKVNTEEIENPKTKKTENLKTEEKITEKEMPKTGYENAFLIGLIICLVGISLLAKSKRRT